MAACWLGWIGLVASPGTASGNPKDTLYEQFYTAVSELEPDATRSAVVDTLDLYRDRGRIHLGPGTLTLCAPIAGRTLAAVYRGAGRLQCMPPTQVERDQLVRFLESETLDTRFESLLLVFADTTLRELGRSLEFAPAAEPDRDVRSFLERALGFLIEEDETHLDPSLMQILLNGNSNEYFYAHADVPKDPDIFFVVDPFQAEEVRVQRETGPRFSKFAETLSQFHWQSDFDEGLTNDFERHLMLATDNYVIRAAITEGFGFGARARFRVRALKGLQTWIPLWLSPSLDVRGVQWGDGESTDFFKGEDSNYLWVSASPPLQAGDERTLTVEYGGDVLVRSDDWTYLESSVSWYPRSFDRERSTFDLTFDAPKDVTLVSVGRKVFQEEMERNRVRSHWVLETPSRNASFNVGFYDDHKIEDDRIPPVTILMNRHGHQAIKEELMQEGIASGRNMKRQVGADVANALAFFQHIYGPCPAEELYVTDVPTLHGEAFPGLINLSWVTFQNTDTAGYDEIFRAHEVAHQWWGFGVDFHSYHDQWLSEGFAEYSGIWYMQEILQDNEKFFERLREWRDEIFDNRKFLFGSGLEAGPISLGVRTSSTETENDYDLVVYKKGAWVLHMLRNLMLDLNTMDETTFLETLRDFYSTYRGKTASTDDFRRVVEEHVGMDMRWFFDQWVHGTALPRFEYSWSSQPTEDGRHLVRMEVEQADVPEDFRSYVPIRINFSGGQYARMRVHLIGSHSEFDLPPLPKEPEEIVFNDMESVLCRVSD